MSLLWADAPFGRAIGFTGLGLSFGCCICNNAAHGMSSVKAWYSGALDFEESLEGGRDLRFAYAWFSG